jgi:hypothetical protein
MNNNAIVVKDYNTKRHVIIPVREILLVQECDNGKAVVSMRSNKQKNLYTENDFDQVVTIYREAIKS